MDNHIVIKWLERIYLPETQPTDESEARLIILDGHGSHATVYLSYIGLELLLTRDRRYGWLRAF